VPCQLQIYEADHLDESKTAGKLANGGRIVRGIEYDAIGRRAAYWLYRDHPGDSGFYMKSLESTRVPASEIIHLFDRKRVQQRGVTWLSAIIQKMRDDDDWTEAELTRKKVEACLVGIVEDADAGDEMISPASADEEAGASGITDSNGNPVEMFEPGMFHYASGGKRVTFNDPKASVGVKEWDGVIAHKIAEGLGIPYELLTGDLSQVNYSSIRTGLVKFKRRVGRQQWQLVIPRLCQPIWDWFVATAYAAGLYDRPTAPVKWTPPAFEEVDRTKEAVADLMEMRSGTLTLPEAIARKGYDPRKQLEEIKEYADLLDELGLVLDSDPRKVNKSGAAQAAKLPGVGKDDEDDAEGDGESGDDAEPSED